MGRVRSWGLLVAAGGLVLTSACSGGGGQATASTAPTTAPAAATSVAAPAATSAATAATTTSRALSRVFPDVDGPTCAASGPEVRTSTGAVPAEAYTCDYSNVAPGAQVIFAEWADTAGAQAWYQDTATLGPRVEDFDNWQVRDVTQGPLYTAENSNGVVISTGVYESLPYTWEIRTSTLDESNAIFTQLGLQQSAQISS